MDRIIERIARAFERCAYLHGIVLGGSRAMGVATESSDIDIGMYYDPAGIDFHELNTIAAELDDAHRENLICTPGDWGNWVNCGGWLTIGGVPVDLILRDWSRVEAILDVTDEGKWACHYQTGHPHAYVDVMYRGELACSRVLRARDEEFLAQKRRAEAYPEKLKQALTGFFGFESGFSCGFVEKYLFGGDAYYLNGHLFRSVSALNQTLFALNGEWLLNEKKATMRIDAFALRPENYSARVNEIFNEFGTDRKGAVQKLRALCDEVAGMI